MDSGSAGEPGGFTTGSAPRASSRMASAQSSRLECNYFWESDDKLLQSEHRAILHTDPLTCFGLLRCCVFFCAVAGTGTWKPPTINGLAADPGRSRSAIWASAVFDRLATEFR